MSPIDKKNHLPIIEGDFVYKLKSKLYEKTT